MMRFFRELAQLWWLLRSWVNILLKKLPILRSLLSTCWGYLVGILRFTSTFLTALRDIHRETIKPMLPNLRHNLFAYVVAGSGFAIIALVLLGPQETEEPAVPAEDIPRELRPTYHVGALLSLTGKYARTGTEMRRGYEFAFEAVNNAGGVIINEVAHNLGLIIYDDESSPVRASEVAELLFSFDNPAIMLAPYSSLLAKPAISVAQQHGAAVVVPVASNVGLDPTIEDVYLLQTPSERHLNAAVNLFVANVARTRQLDPKAKKPFVNGTEPRIVVVATPDAHAQAVIGTVTQALAQAELTDIVTLDLNLPPEEFSNAAQALGSIDALFMSAYADGSLKILDIIATEGFTVPFLAMTHCTQAHITQAEPTVAEGALCTVHWQQEAHFPGTTPLEKGFAPSYYKVYGSNPSHHAAAAAAAAQMIARALKRSELANHDIRGALRLTNFKSLYGPIRFANGSLNSAKPMVLSQVVQSRYIPVAPANIATQSINFHRPQLARKK